MVKVKVTGAADPWDELSDFLTADENQVLMPSRHLFDETRYLAKNPDVASAVERGAIASGHAHWLAHGKSEARAFTETEWASPSEFAKATFDERRYLAENPDVAAALAGRSIASAAEHWERHGRAEGRRYPSRAVVVPVTEWAARHGLYGVLPARVAPPRSDEE